MVATPRAKQAASSSATSIPTTTETVVATLPPFSTDGAAQSVLLQAVVDFTVGTAATTAVIRIRRGTTAAGTIVATSGSLTVAAGNLVSLSCDGVDQPGEVADQQYVVTVQQGAATGNGANVLAAISGIVTS